MDAHTSFESSSHPSMSHDPGFDASEGANARESTQEFSNLIVVLDLDDCLVHTKRPQTSGSENDEEQCLNRQKENHKTNVPNVSDSNAKRFSYVMRGDDGDSLKIVVYERPGLREFLADVCSRFETHVFTNALESYAAPILNELDPSGKLFAGRWYREYASRRIKIGRKTRQTKDLTMLPFLEGKHEDRLERVVLVDNDPLNFWYQPNNGIHIRTFGWKGDGSGGRYEKAMGDRSLELTKQLLDELNDKADVRPILKERFETEQALELLQRAQGSDARDAVPWTKI